MTWDLVTATGWTLEQGPTLYRRSQDNPTPPHPMIVTGNVLSSRQPAVSV